jgi:hypothetical protein
MVHKPMAFQDQPWPSSLLTRVVSSSQPLGIQGWMLEISQLYKLDSNIQLVLCLQVVDEHSHQDMTSETHLFIQKSKIQIKFYF